MRTFVVDVTAEHSACPVDDRKALDRQSISAAIRAWQVRSGSFKRCPALTLRSNLSVSRSRTLRVWCALSYIANHPLAVSVRWRSASHVCLVQRRGLASHAALHWNLHGSASLNWDPNAIGAMVPFPPMLGNAAVFSGGSGQRWIRSGENTVA